VTHFLARDNCADITPPYLPAVWAPRVTSCERHILEPELANKRANKIMDSPSLVSHAELPLAPPEEEDACERSLVSHSELPLVPPVFPPEEEDVLASSLALHFGLSPEEKARFLLNLENEAYASAVYDEATQADLFDAGCLNSQARCLLTQDIREKQDEMTLYNIAHRIDKSTGRWASLMALAVVAGGNPNHRLCPLDYVFYSGSVNLVRLLLNMGAKLSAGTSVPRAFTSKSGRASRAPRF